GFDIRHIVIDEAQDMSLFQIDMLKTLMNTGSFTILGDLCQGIYAFKGLSSWEDVSEKVFGGRGRFMPLERSYRTTVEIMDYASKTADLLKLNVPRAVPVIRHGPAVVHKECAAGKDQAAAIDGIIKAYQQNGRQSAAVICKTPDECQRLKKLLKSPGIRLLTGREKDYGGGTVILPAYLSKGLEFDGVVIADASRFGMTETDVKLLYVAMTRALHELSVVSVK
ncbi:MAG: ATP-binding domain-containing protein, partial [Clostridiales bacterium]|nr:ATP-binding domain-containing protein [Clostridiales bacterium]